MSQHPVLHSAPGKHAVWQVWFTVSHATPDAQSVVQAAAKDTSTVKQYLTRFEQAGADEVICFPASADLAQVEALAQAAGL